MSKNCLFLFCLFCFSSYAQYGDQQILVQRSSAWTAEIGDIDGDGLDDLVFMVRTEGDLRLAWYNNQGDGDVGDQITIDKYTDLLYSYTPCPLRLVDLNNDSKLDILIGLPKANKVGWYENLGDGNFESLQTIADVDIYGLRDVHSFDVDNDGDFDVLSCSYVDQKVAWYENLGDGTFSDQNIVTLLANQITFLRSEDLDEDGYEDIISICSNADYIYWYRNLGDGTFGIQEVFSSELDLPIDLKTSDVDNDGDIDILTASFNDDKIGWYENLGAGVYSSHQIISDTTLEVRSIYLYDINGDGDEELFFSSAGENSVGWYENLGAGSFGTGEIISLETDYPALILSWDVNGDSHKDLYAFSFDDDKMQWFENEDGIGFGERQIINYSVNNPSEIIAEDLDGDGDKEIIIITAGDGAISISENLEGTHFGEFAVIFNEGLYTSNLMSFDLDEDGDFDILANKDTIIFWLENNGDGTFEPFQVIAYSDHDISFIELEDLDFDGDLDIFSISYSADEVSWYENIGVGEFSDPIITSISPNGPTNSILADLDDDGDLDVVLFAIFDDKLLWFENLGGFTFGEEHLILEDDLAGRPIGSEDFDMDGDLDIAVFRYESNKLAWYENEDGLFDEVHVINTEGLSSPKDAIMADIDSDGDLDIIITFNFDRIYLIETLGDSEFSSPKLITNKAFDINEIGVSDLNEDGDLEILSCSSDDYKVAWYENFFIHETQIKGQLYIDLNENGLHDSLDFGLNGLQIIVSPENELTYTYDIGKFGVVFIDTIGTYIVAPEALDHWIIVSDSLSYTINVDSGFTFIDSLDFGFYPDTLFDQVSTELVGAFPRCNNLINYWINIKNTGTTVPSGLIHLELDDAITYFDAAITPDSIIGQNIYWHYDSLFYFDSDLIALQVEMPPADDIGDTLLSSVTVTIDSLDGVVYTNTITLAQVLSCAYDPNDKIAYPVGEESLGYIPPSTTDLDYTIRFQNTGTDTAFVVVIKDSLDLNLDWTSFTLLASSHSVSTFIDHEGEVTFTFNDILLPDSNVNEIASHGFIKYNIEINEGTEIGTSIYNTANIYFDENPAIITNTKINTIYDCTTILESLSIDSIFCEDHIVSAEFLDSPGNPIIVWTIEDVFEYEGELLIWIADTSGIFDLMIDIETDFCLIDTIVSIKLNASFYSLLDTIYLCPGDSISIFGNYESTAGEYYDSLSTIYGCDSINIQELLNYELPTLEFYDLEDEVICLEADLISLSGIPSGGTFSGIGVTGSSFNPSDVDEGEHVLYYTYEDDNGCSSIDSIKVMVVDCLDLPNEKGNQITIFPNPFNEYTTVDFGNELGKNYTIIIHNILGQEIYRIQNVIGSSIEINKAQLGVGVHILTILNSDLEQIYTSKLIVE